MLPQRCSRLARKAQIIKCQALYKPANNNVYIIKCKSHPLSYTETLPNGLSNHYVIGFQNLMLARKVQYNMTPEPCFRLYRRNWENVTDEVNAGLESLGSSQIDGSVVLDTQALLHVPLKDASLPDAMNEGMFHLETVSFEDFLMYPFDKNVGIIMPYNIEKEDGVEIVITSNVVENAKSVKSFRSMLNKML